MADNRINVILGAEDQATKVVTGLRAQFDRFKKDAIKGFGLQAGFSAFNAAKRVIGEVTDAIGDSIAAAREEEASIVRLSTALEDNIEGWEGGKTAVEGWIAANQDAYLFADNEQRQALSGLLGATRDLTQAQNLLNLAMDLARFRNMDLKTASDLLARVYAGNLGTLSRYGIIVRKGASSTEALAEIQRLAGGQAEAYAGTSESSAERATLAWADAQESFGTIFDGIATAAADASASIASSLIDWMPSANAKVLNEALDQSLSQMTMVEGEAKGMFDLLAGTEDAFEFLSPTLRRWNMMWEEMGPMATAAGISYRDFGDAIERLERQLGGLVEAGVMDESALDGAIAAVLRETLHGLASVEVQAGETAPEVDEAVGEAAAKRAEAFAKAVEHVAGTSFDDLKEAAKDTRDAIMDAFKDPMDPLRALRREEQRLARQRNRAMRAGRFDIVAMIDARQDEIDAEQKARRQTNRFYQAERKEQQERRADLEKLAKKFDLTRQEAVDLYKQANKDITIAIDIADARAKLDALHARIAALDDDPVYLRIVAAGGQAGSGGGGGSTTVIRAHGGPTSPGQSYLVGEYGPEVLHMGSQGGYVQANVGGGGGHGHVIVMDGRVVGELVDARLGRRSATLGRDNSYRSAV